MLGSCLDGHIQARPNCFVLKIANMLRILLLLLLSLLSASANVITATILLLERFIT
jgi:hypothetical protein